VCQSLTNAERGTLYTLFGFAMSSPIGLRVVTVPWTVSNGNMPVPGHFA
jgi:hypothetical protein